jgi:hypothetical protein
MALALPPIMTQMAATTAFAAMTFATVIWAVNIIELGLG